MSQRVSMHPFTEIHDHSAASLGETALIERIREWLGASAPPSPAGPGDDCAVWQPAAGERVLITTDPVIHGRHFDDRASPEEAAAKLLRRNLSDIAAMGGKPSAAVLSLFLPPRTALRWLESFHRALAGEAAIWKVDVTGGDICATDGMLGIGLTLFGETVDNRFLPRVGAANGDWIAVTGALGGSLAGRHLRFDPRLAEGQWLARQPESVAMMDVSDGLAKDLPSMLSPQWQARVETETIPVSQDAATMAEASGRSALHHALCDGEDYELLVILKSAADPKAFAERWKAAGFALPFTIIGRVRERTDGTPPVIWTRDGHAVTGELFQGYEHLR